MEGKNPSIGERKTARDARALLTRHRNSRSRAQSDDAGELRLLHTKAGFRVADATLFDLVRIIAKVKQFLHTLHLLRRPFQHPLGRLLPSRLHGSLAGLRRFVPAFFAASFWCAMARLGRDASTTTLKPPATPARTSATVRAV